MSITPLPDLITNTSVIYEVISRRTKQPPPYELATAYSKRRFVITSSEGDRGFGIWRPSTYASPETEPFIAQAQVYAYNKAYDRFVAKLGEKSSFGSTLTAERRETFSMITGLVTRAYRATRAAQKGKILDVFHELGFNPPVIRKTTRYKRPRKRPVYVKKEYYVMPNGKTVLKASANTWLLWSYGVSPLLSDINNATEVFIRSLPRGVKIRAGATEPLKDSYYDDDQGIVDVHVQGGVLKVGITSTVMVENHDLWLLNQLGLVNPMQFANEAVPFSFVIDWASNWSSVINSLTDFVGLNLKNSCTSTKITLKQSFYSYNTRNYNWYQTNGVTRDVLIFDRTLGIKRPTLSFRFERFGWQRFLNAISLLVGFLPASPKNK